MVALTAITVVSDSNTIVSLPFPVNNSHSATSTGIADAASESSGNFQELSNIPLAPEEVATLRSLVERYDQVIQDLDHLNAQIESLLQAEGIKACES